jgi:hypothetical protein
VTRIALFSACACLALLGACKDSSAGGAGTAVTGVSGLPITPAPEVLKNSSLIKPVVQQTYTTFSANQHLKLTGVVGSDVTISGSPLPQAATDFSLGAPTNGNTIKPTAVVRNVYYEGSQPIDATSDVTIDFNPRDAVYTIQANTASITANTRFQDPAHRTVYQQSLVPTLGNYRYSEAGTGVDTPAINANSTVRDISTIFVRDVGTTGSLTQYVTIAGFVQQKYNESETTRVSAPGSTTVGVDFTSDIARSVFAFGLNTPHKDVPKSGSATYAGDMYAHVVITPQNFATGNDLRSIVGTSSTNVDFSTGKLTLSLNGNVVGFAGDTRAFAAQGTMDIFKPATDTTNSRFSGAVGSWSFGAYNATGGTSVPTAASTVEGGFFGPKAEEIGGAFRIIGSRPDERIDILGAFTGKKN